MFFAIIYLFYKINNLEKKNIEGFDAALNVNSTYLNVDKLQANEIRIGSWTMKIGDGTGDFNWKDCFIIRHDNRPADEAYLFYPDKRNIFGFKTD
jgi:hypothetical protein